MWWGFSEAIDLLEEEPPTCKSEECNKTKKEVNILLIGQCDCRHVLKTIAQKYRHKDNTNLNLYIYEPVLENVARELLFITLALEPPKHLGIAEKTLFFMELYGNSLLRPATAKYLTKVSKRLLNFITNFNYAEQVLPVVCLEKLKYKERDQLEIIFKYWASINKSFDILRAWDERLRRHLGTRYDARSGVYDWDYHMRYCSYGMETLKLHEYKKFREKGISFYFDDTDSCLPNSTLASAIFSSGSKVLSYGYLGDIVTGPYITYGFKTDDKDLLKKVNGQISKSATNVSERNIMRIFHEIQHQTPFLPESEDDNGYNFIMEDNSSSIKIQLEPIVESDESKIKLKDACEVYESLSAHNCKIIFMPTTALTDFPRKSDYKNFFDSVFISQTLVLKLVKPDLFKMCKSNCKVIVDTPLFLLHYRKEDLEKFKHDLENLMKDCQCKLAKPYNYEQDQFVEFKVEEQ